MTNEGFDRIWTRIQADLARLQEKEGQGYEWEAKTSDGRMQAYKVKGLRHPVEHDGILAHLFTDAWSLKDYVVAEAEAHGKDEEWVSAQVRGSQFLMLVHDVATVEKHGKISRPLTHYGELRIGSPTDLAPQDAIQSISLGPEGIVTTFKGPEGVERATPISDGDQVVGYAEPVLEGALSDWKAILRRARHEK